MKGSDGITIQQQIDMALVYSNMTKTELATKLGYASIQAFNQRFRTGKFTKEELEQIGYILGAEYKAYFKYPDGKEI